MWVLRISGDSLAIAWSERLLRWLIAFYGENRWKPSSISLLNRPGNFGFRLDDGRKLHPVAKLRSPSPPMRSWMMRTCSRRSIPSSRHGQRHGQCMAVLVTAVVLAMYSSPECAKPKGGTCLQNWKMATLNFGGNPCKRKMAPL